MSKRLCGAVFSILLGLGAAQGRACELLAGSSATPTKPQSLLTAFWSHSKEDNIHGWGLAVYMGNAVAIFKEPQAAITSPLASFVTTHDAAKGKLFIAHIREASVGGQALHNTHPFAREWKGREYVLAHNGTLKGFKEKMPLNGFTPTGSTDSEYLLCHLLGRLKDKNVQAWDSASFAWLHEELRAMNACGSLNCTFSDGDLLFAYHDKSGYNSLHWSANTREGMLVSTKALPHGIWERFKPGQLMVFQDGKRVYPLS